MPLPLTGPRVPSVEVAFVAQGQLRLGECLAQRREDFGAAVRGATHGLTG